jgi:hypothetical protein
MKPKVVMVELISGSGTLRSFEKGHAERILAMGPERNGGWAIAPGSKYQFDEENDVISIRTDSGSNSETE